MRGCNVLLNGAPSALLITSLALSRALRLKVSWVAPKLT
jgi:hypothetical protein